MACWYPAISMGQYAVNVGDTIRVTAGTYGQRTDIDMKIVGGFDLFPTWYPEDKGPLFVGNLDYLFEQAGGEFPYEVWMSTGIVRRHGLRPRSTTRRSLQDVQKLGIKVITSDASVPAIVTEQRRPERQGLFGLLSVGFVAAALLTVLGFFLYALFSFRQRTIELGILRAMGLSPVQMTSLLAWELAFLILTGLAAGTLFGRLDQPTVHTVPASGQRGRGACATLPGGDRLAGHLPHLCAVRPVVHHRPGRAGCPADADEDLPGYQTG